MKRLIPLAAAATLAACTTETPRPVATVAPPRAAPAVGIDRVMGRDAAALTALLGPPALDAREGPARRMQWRGACVLDAYLYPRSGAGPLVTYLDARDPRGTDVDRAGCLAALASTTGAVARR